MKSVLLAAAAVILSACASPAPNLVELDPSNPDAPVRPSRYVPVTAGTLDYRPVEPKSWLRQNQEVAPKAEGQP